MQRKILLFLLLVFPCFLTAQTTYQQGYYYKNIAGSGCFGFSNYNGVPATAACIQPYGLALDTGGTIYFTDINAIGRITGGQIYIIAGIDSINGYFDDGIASDAILANANAIAIDKAGNIYVADAGNNIIRKINPALNTITTIAGTPQSYGFSGDNGPATNAQLSYLGPGGIAVDTSGNVFFADYDNQVIRMVPANDGTYFGINMVANYIYTIAGIPYVPGYSGIGGTATLAEINYPTGLAVDVNGNVYFYSGNVINPVIEMVPAISGTYFAQVMTAGNIYAIAGDTTEGYTGDGGLATQAEISQVLGITFDSTGNLYFADYNNAAIREVSVLNDSINTIYPVGSFSTPQDLITDKSGDFYFSRSIFANIAEIIPGPTLSLSFSVVGQTACDGTLNGSATANVTGGVPPYSYYWSNYLENDPYNLNIAAGVYSLTVTDSIGTVYETSVIVPNQEPPLPEAPVALLATNGTINGFTADWRSDTGAIGYYLDVAFDSAFSAIVPGYNNLNAGNDTTYSVTGLSDNLTYYYRVRSANVLCTSNNSNTISIAIVPQIVAAEYFWDADPGIGNGIPCISFTDSDSVNFNQSVPLSGLSGSHILYFRTEDDGGEWSLSEGTPVTILPQIITAEYFWDTDPGIGNGTPCVSFTASDSVNFNQTVSLTGLSGKHVLYFRTVDAGGSWSLSEGATIIISPKIVAAEYFWDTDPGIGNGTPAVSFTAADSVNVNQTISLSGLSGTHVLYFRTEDNAEEWSLSEGTSITVTPRIVAAEYFWDTDPGVGNGTPCTSFTASDSVNFNQTVPLAGLSGSHILYFRTKDDGGEWSLSEGTPVTILPQIITAEYFWDTDPGIGNGTPCVSFTASDSVNFNQTVSLAGLSGKHVLYFRTVDAGGSWSLSEGATIIISPKIVAAEYFWDTDPGIGNGTPCVSFTASDSVNFNQTVSLTGLSGKHVLYFRTEDAGGSWSLSEGATIIISPKIVAAEYFWDTDPGLGKGTPTVSFTTGDSVNFNQTISLAGLSGTHVLYFRTEDNAEEWSLSEGTSIIVTPKIVSAEYFWDTDPGVGNGTPCTSFTAADSVNFNQTISLAGISGTHILYFRTKDAGGEWSLSEGSAITVTPKIVTAEYFWDTDPGVGKGTPAVSFTAADSANFTQAISLAGLSGSHILYFRTKDAGGEWSLSEGTSISVIPKITAAEYFWDTDPGVGKGTPCASLAAADSANFNQTVSLAGLSGNHIVYFRTKDAGGEWSLSEGSAIAVSGTTSITTNAVSPLTYCNGNAVSVPYVVAGTFNAGNVFTAQLSNANGSFSSPVNIGTIQSTAAGTISATIPANTAGGAGYRIRVVGNNPTVTGSDNGSDIIVQSTLSITVNPLTSVCTGGASAVLTASGASTYTWAPNTFISATTGAVVTIQTALLTFYTLTGITTNGCSASLVVPVATATAGGTISPALSIICSGATKGLTASGAAGNDYQWQISADNVNWSNITGATNTAYTTAGSDGTGNKFYRLMSQSNSCWNVTSTTAEVDISNPTIAVTATNVTDNSLTLSWSPAGTGNYSINYSGASSGTQTSITPPKTITGLTSGGTYSVTVTQTGVSGCSASGTITGVNTLCSMPTGVSLSSPAASQIQVTWTGVPGADYRVYYRPLFSYNTYFTQDVSNATGVLLTRQGNNTLYGSTTYEVYVSRLNCPGTGVVGQGSTPANITTLPALACATPQIDSVRSVCPVQLEVFIHDNGVNQYDVFIQRLTPSILAVNSYGVSGTYFTINTPYSGDQYLIALQSKCGSALSALYIWPGNITIKPLCDALGNLVLSNPTCTGFTASWNADQCQSNTAGGYDLYLRVAGTINYNSYGVSLPSPGIGPNKLVNWATSGRSYQVFVRSIYNCNGFVTYGPTSEVGTITTLSSGCRDEEQTNEPQENKPAVQQYSQDDKEVFSLYPNPNNGGFLVSLSKLNMEENAVRIEVFNMLGQTIMTYLTTISGGQMSEYINLPGGAATGTYIVRLTAGKNVYAAKINVSK